MTDYISRDDALLHSEIIRVYSKDYGNIDVVPVEYLADIPAADVQPVSVIKELQEHIKQRILETSANNGGIYGEVAEDIANHIDIWVDEFRRADNG